MDYLAKLVNKIKNVVRTGTVTGPENPEFQNPIQQMKIKGSITNVMQIFPYGVYSNVSSNDSLGIVFSIEGSENNRAALSFTPKKRPSDLQQNELAIYHPYTESFIKFRNNGNIEIDSNQNENSNVIINCQQANINAADSVNIDSPLTNLGVGGNDIARVGDSVEVIVTRGSSSGTYSGTITSGGVNTSI